jgi:hypothetical protein
MSAILARSPIENSSANNPLPIQLPSAPQQGGGAQMPQISSALMQGLTNYFNQGTQAAGNPNAVTPSMGSSLMQGVGNSLDGSAAGQLINNIAGNGAGNGYASQLMKSIPPDWLQSILGSASTTAGTGTAAAGAADSGAASSGGALDGIMSIFS